jgi:hypothetical protein
VGAQKSEPPLLLPLSGTIIMLVGGPGIFASCDPVHDKQWINYFRPIQLATEGHLYGNSYDDIHWVIYEPAYEARWLDDSVISWGETAGKIYHLGDLGLNNTRKAHADEVTRALNSPVSRLGAINYFEFVKLKALKAGVTYKGIRTADAFWDYLATFRVNSIIAVWYSGHASPAGLFLMLTHDNECSATVAKGDLLTIESIYMHATLKDRFVKDTKQPSKFYGCRTADFASKWHEVFEVPTEGAVNKVTYKGIYDAPDAGVLQRLETTQTGAGSPEWTQYY